MPQGIWCPKCGSKNLAVERRPNGDASCSSCGWKGPYAECFEKEVEDEPLPPMSPAGERISIVFESGGCTGINEKGQTGHQFYVYMEGAKRPLEGLTLEEKTTCEFYAHHFFKLISAQMQQVGMVSPKGVNRQ